jgi:hypothetical protein
MQMRVGSTAPTPDHLGLLGRLFKTKARLAGYSDVSLFIADMRLVENNERTVCLIPPADLSLPTEEEAERKLQTFANAHDVLVREGFDPKAERTARRRERPGDDPQPSLF